MPCVTQAWPREQNSLRALRALRSNNCSSQLTKRVNTRAAARPARLRRQPLTAHGKRRSLGISTAAVARAVSAIQALRPTGPCKQRGDISRHANAGGCHAVPGPLGAGSQRWAPESLGAGGDARTPRVSSTDSSSCLSATNEVSEASSARDVGPE